MCLDLRIFDEDYKIRSSQSLSSGNRQQNRSKGGVLPIMQFTVKSKETENEYTVFAVNHNSFLIYANGEFVWKPMDLFYIEVSGEVKGTNYSEPRNAIFKRSKSQNSII